MSDRIAIRATLRHESRSTARTIEVVALRRPEVTLRRTDYRGFVIDERLLTQPFPWVVPKAPRLQAMICVSGRALWEDLVLQPFELALMRPEHVAFARLEDFCFVDLEWVCDAATRDGIVRPARLGALERSKVEGLAAAIGDASRDQRELFGSTFSLLGQAGVPLGDLAVAGLQGGPTKRDERISVALEAQLANLATRADATTLGELAALSPRQLQRALRDFSERYGVNSGNWRDVRNRLRLQIAAALLSVEEVSVSDIAAEVGYASAPALARAFAAIGFPTPTALRQALRDGSLPPRP
ncbi:MAG TPA: helix-turn-helix domain-containing protein [Labilithrix sp.]|nr:helix-turn-helix domain-containing protein [Labilithrix sp.]